MKTLEMYQCEKCLSTYIDKHHAESCEDSHFGVCSSTLKYVEGGQYPSSIEMFFKDGVSILYTVSEVTRPEDDEE